MSKRRAEIAVLCEDLQSHMFFKYLLRAYGRRYYVRNDYPAGRGCGFQYIQENYADMVAARRRAPGSRALLVHMDADEKRVSDRLQTLAAALEQAGAAPRGKDEPVALIVPKRCIEAWIWYLRGEKAGEEEADWPSLRRPSKCKPESRRLADMLRQHQQWPADAPDSLNQARPEFARVLP
jgi:hypothetical protein